MGTSGRALNMLSGGIDSPVAAYRMAKRGLALDHIHFASPPYTSERAKLKVKALAEKVLEVMEDRPIQYVYPLEMPLKQKVEAIAKKIYRADGVNFSAAASKTLAELTELGYGDLPVCIAKTQYSFSDKMCIRDSSYFHL